MRFSSLGRIRITPKRIAIRLPRRLLVYCIVLSIILLMQLVVRGGTSMILGLSLLYALVECERDAVIIDARKRQILRRRRNAGYTVYDFADAVSVVRRLEKAGRVSYALKMEFNGEDFLIALTPPLFPHQVESEHVKELVEAVGRMVFPATGVSSTKG